MSALRTEGQVITAIGIPQPTGLILTTETGLLLTTAPVGEPPGGVNTEPGTDPNATLGMSNTGWSQDSPGVPYGFVAPVSIGPTQ